MEPDAIVDGLKWVMGTIIALLSTLGAILGLGRIREMREKRRYDLQDKTLDVHTTTEQARIAAETEQKRIEAGLLPQFLEWQKAVEERFDGKLNKLEREVEKLTKDLSEQREMNAKKDVKIEHLEQENERLRLKCSEQDKVIARLEAEIDQLRKLINRGGDSLHVVSK